MHPDPDDRKKTVLPCGYTLAQSWMLCASVGRDPIFQRAKITPVGMLEYASRIRKLQQEIGIPVKQFDADILNEQDLYQNQSRKSCFYISSKERDENQTTLKEVKMGRKTINSCTYRRPPDNSTDYEKMMDRSLEAIGSKHIAIPSPREELFSNPTSKGGKVLPLHSFKKGHGRIWR